MPASTVVKAFRKFKVVPAAFWRGGTSKGLIFSRQDLPKDREVLDALFLDIMGSPDPYGRQLDGMGGGLSSLSKICIVEPSSRKDADVDYTFVQIGVRADPVVDYSSQCGNMVSAIGPHCIRFFRRNSSLFYDNGGQRMARVRVYNTNTNKIVYVVRAAPISCTVGLRNKKRFPVGLDDELAIHGSFSIDGVPGKAARITCEYRDPGGSKTGAFLPTGNVVDRLEEGQLEASLIDCANPCIFLRASDLGVEGTITPDEMLSHPTLLNRLEALRQEGAVAMGLAQTPEQTPLAVPKICLVGPVASDSATADLLIRTISSKDPHRAIPTTVALAAAAASRCNGSLVQQCLSQRQPVDPLGVTIAHPSGNICVDATVGKNQQGEPDVQSAVVDRTARLLFKGEVYTRRQ